MQLSLIKAVISTPHGRKDDVTCVLQGRFEYQIQLNLGVDILWAICSHLILTAALNRRENMNYASIFQTKKLCMLSVMHLEMMTHF